MLPEPEMNRPLRRGFRASVFRIVSVLVVSSAVSACVATTGGGTSAPDTAGRVEGSQITRSDALGLTREDQSVALKAEFRALEITPAGAAVSWRNPATGHSGDVLPGPAYQVNAQSCRDYTHTVEAADGASFQATACRGPDGVWQVVT